MSGQKNHRPKRGCSKDLCYHFSCCSCGRRCHWNGRIEGVLSELLYADDLIWM